MDIGGEIAGFASGVNDSFNIMARPLASSDGPSAQGIRQQLHLWFGLMTCFAFFGGARDALAAAAPKGRQVASRSVIVFMILLVLGGLVWNAQVSRTKKCTGRVAEKPSRWRRHW